jgi:hypothetical protein
MQQYQGVWTLQQQMQALTSGQWVTDPNFKNTTLLLQGDSGANGAQNNLFLDTSPNQFALTRNGNTTQGSFTPFSNQPGAWGNYFGGSSDYLLLPSNSANFLHTGAADWTFECWFWATQTSTTATLFSTAAESAQVGIFIGLNNAVSAGINVAIYRAAGGGVTYGFRTNASVFTANTWNHVAITYSQSGNTYAIYLNGISQTLTTSGTASYSGSNATYQPAIGRFQDASPGGYYSGYISNMRAVNGSRVYTANFTPSPIPLTAITSTAFLTCQSNRFVDNSTNAYTVTVNGTPSVQAFSPFAPQYQWTSDVIGGSGYFDGSGDYLSAGSNAAFAFGTGAYTVEVWLYPTTIDAIDVYVATDSTNGFQMYQDGGRMRIGQSGVGVVVETAAGVLTANAWNHIVVCRASTSANQASIFINGSRRANGTDATNWSVTGPLVVSQATYPVNGYMTSVRVVKGTDVYGYNNTSITVPTAPLTAIANTSLLLNFTNAGIYDGTMKNNLETVGNAQISTSVVKYGSGSIGLPDTTSYLIEKDYSNYNFGTGDFTIECWLYITGALSGDQYVIDFPASGALHVGINIFSSGWRIGGFNSYLITGSTGLVQNSWIHVAMVRSNGTLYAYINGTLLGSIAANVSFSSTGAVYIGRYYAGTASNNLTGNIDDLRISKFARYLSNFTPPLVALPRQ